MKVKDLSALLFLLGSPSVFAGEWVCSVSKDGHNQQAIKPVITAGAEVSPEIPFQYNEHQVSVCFNQGDEFEPQKLLWLAIDGISSQTYNPSEKSLYSLTLKDGTSLQCSFVAAAKVPEQPPAKIKNLADIERLWGHIDHYDRSLEHNLRNALVLGQKARTLVKLADLTQNDELLLSALECFSMALDVEEFNTDDLADRAKLHLRLGNKEAARADMEKFDGIQRMPNWI